MILYKFIRKASPNQEEVELVTFKVEKETNHCWKITSLAGYPQMVQRYGEKKYAAATIKEAWQIFETQVELAIRNAEQIIKKCATALENGHQLYECESKKALDTPTQSAESKR